MIVADAGPIIAFAPIGRLDLLQQGVGEIAIPPAVYRELVVEGMGRAGAAGFEEGTLLNHSEHTPYGSISTRASGKQSP
jgi:predicted nucleic acid-binding protein